MITYWCNYYHLLVQLLLLAGAITITYWYNYDHFLVKLWPSAGKIMITYKSNYDSLVAQFDHCLLPPIVFFFLNFTSSTLHGSSYYTSGTSQISSFHKLSVKIIWESKPIFFLFCWQFVCKAWSLRCCFRYQLAFIIFSMSCISSPKKCVPTEGRRMRCFSFL